MHNFTTSRLYQRTPILFPQKGIVMHQALQKFLGAQVRVYRDIRGISQVELAERMGVSKETIGKMERGTTAPSFKTLDSLCRELGISPRNLFPPSKYERHKSATTAMERLIAKAWELDDAEINWIIELIDAVENKP